MEQLNQALNANLNLLVATGLFILAMAAMMLVGAAITLVPQVHRTLTAYERLASTVESELEPTLMEANKLMGGFLKLQDLAQHGVVDMTTKVEDVRGQVERITGEAHKKTSVWQAGLLAGIRAYLEFKGDREKADHASESTNTPAIKRASSNRGNENV